MSSSAPLDVEALLNQLTLDEKVELLAGQGSFRMTGLPSHGIPALIVRLDMSGQRRLRLMLRVDI
jgi:beta-glucosidase